MRRRTLLALGSGALAGTAGCLDALGLRGDTATDDPSGDVTGTPTRDDGTTDPGVVGTFDPPASADHRLYVENRDDEPYLADVEVIAADTGAAVLAGRYELPDGRGIEFPPVVPWDRTYEVSLALVDVGLADTFEWETGECAGPVSSGGSRNGSLRIAEGGTDLSFVVDGCDSVVAGTAVATGPASNFVVAGPTPREDSTTTADPTPGFTRGCPPLLSADPVDDEADVPEPSVVDYEGLPADRKSEFDRAVASGSTELDGDYSFWTDEAEYVEKEGTVYGVAIAVC